MYSVVKTLNFEGLKGEVVNVEASISKGMLAFYVGGQVDKTIRESREKIRSSFAFYKIKFPYGKVNINLTPANTKKTGAHFDLPIALSIYAAKTNIVLSDDTIFVGEINLTGKLLELQNPLKYIKFALSKGYKKIVIPKKTQISFPEIPNISIYLASNIYEVFQYASNINNLEMLNIKKLTSINNDEVGATINDIIGQERLIRALIISLCGGHSMIIKGPMGCGKSSSVNSLESIMPMLNLKKFIDLNVIENELYKQDAIFRPFGKIYKPMISISTRELFGTDKKIGQINLGKYGLVLFDDINLFKSEILDRLKKFLEDPFPATIIGVLNFCPCGNLGNKLKRCDCASGDIDRYMKRIDGALLDRFTIHIGVESVNINKDKKGSMDISQIKSKIKSCWDRQERRYNSILITNENLEYNKIRKYINISSDLQRFLNELSIKYKLNKRTIDKAIKISRTIADYENHNDISYEDMSEAFTYIKKSK